MATVKLLDDPGHINAFLSMIGASQIISTVDTVAENEEDKKRLGNEQATNDDHWDPHPAILQPTAASLDLDKMEIAGTVTPEVCSCAHSTIPSPAVGPKAPPPTPVSTAKIWEPAAKLEPIEKDVMADILVKLAEESKLGLSDSKFAHKLRYPVAEYNPGALLGISYNQRSPVRVETTSSFTPNIKKDMVIEGPGKVYMDQVVSDLQKKHVSDFKRADKVLSVQQIPVENVLAPFNGIYETTPSVKPLGKVSQDVKIAESKSSNTEAAVSNSSPSEVQENMAGTDESELVEEDREYLAHFKSWGKREVRYKAAARVRRVALSSLPVDADITLVQSLVYGGAIDDMLLMEAARVAYVSFTSGDTCDAYCAKCPNGLKFKSRGRAHTVFVNKCKDVDVISGILQGYIDCGATRCVRAIGVDEDWGMGALKKLAEGKSRRGKVENITDVERNGIRTIVFRFTSIGDAVAFKAMLTREEDWEACNIQFMADPCEIARDIHLE